MTFSKRLIPAVAVFLLATLPAYGAARPGDVVFQADFDAADGLNQWDGAVQPGIRLQQRTRTSKCLYVERPATAGPGSNSARTRLPLEKLLRSWFGKNLSRPLVRIEKE